MEDKILENKNISLYEFARWAALLEAVEIIAEKCEDRGIDFDSAEGRFAGTGRIRRGHQMGAV